MCNCNVFKILMNERLKFDRQRINSDVSTEGIPVLKNHSIVCRSYKIKNFRKDLSITKLSGRQKQYHSSKELTHHGS